MLLAASLVAAIVFACGTDAPPSKLSTRTLRSAIASALDGWRQSAAPETGVAVPGASAAVVSRDGDVVAAASGSADEVPVTAESVFRLASVTKLVTAAIVVQLDQEGRLSVDDPIARWVTYPNGEAITVAMRFP